MPAIYRRRSPQITLVFSESYPLIQRYIFEKSIIVHYTYVLVAYFRESLAGVLAATEALSGSILCILLDNPLWNPISSKLCCETSGRTVLVLCFSKFGLDVT